MSKTNRFIAKVGRGVKKAYTPAAESVRAKGLEIRIDEQYENLGRIVYRDLHTEEDLEQIKLEIIAKIDALFDELEQIKAAKEERKAKKAQAAAERAEECAECDETCDEVCTEECDGEAQAPTEEKTDAE